MRAALLAAGLCLLAPASWASPSDLYERNYAFLLGTLPEGAIMEVAMAQDGAWVTQLWSAEQYAAFRAAHAAAMGRDYQAAPEGAPFGLGDAQEFGDLWGDVWGRLTTNVATPRGLPSTLVLDSKFWFYGGPSSTIGVWEVTSGCPAGVPCTAIYGWTSTQNSFQCEEAWLAGSGTMFQFGFPFGGLFQLNGLILCDYPGP